MTQPLPCKVKGTECVPQLFIPGATAVTLVSIVGYRGAYKTQSIKVLNKRQIFFFK